MTVQERISKLNDLLERVRRNANAPRPAVAHFAFEAAPTREEPRPAVAPIAFEAAPAREEPQPAMAGAAPLSAFEELPARTQRAGEPQGPELDVVEVEFLDEEILDITDLPADELALLEEHADMAAASAAQQEPVLEPPASSRRLIAATMDEALAGAADQAGEPEREVPLKTPPPESGRQVAMPPAAQLQQAPPPMDLAEAEAALDRGPSIEQLGGIVELEEQSPVELELALPPVAPARVSEVFETELELSRESAPVEAAERAPAPDGRTEAEQVSEPVSEPAVSQVVSVGSVLPAASDEAAGQPIEAPPVVPIPLPSPAAIAAMVPETLRRGETAELAPVFVSPAAPRRPETFLELLEASLSL